jgi:hypothetical protein
MNKVTEMYAFVVADKDGNEGVPAFSSPSGLMMPMVGADMHRVYQLLPIAQSLFPGKFKIMHFANGEDITQAIMDNG